ncbi:hypothetical protein OXYTRIMIC_213 [Oxytricha trifallax]|uniref:Uncharacterized protein n=1 Tax=Oxytricha trifallax TaxID=1172189 RepID=A0A073IAW5_9SPIT|nr:hypothetical protein OXYTRIMIC_213 [Oxytricha trifallax]
MPIENLISISLQGGKITSSNSQDLSIRCFEGCLKYMKNLRILLLDNLVQANFHRFSNIFQYTGIFALIKYQLPNLQKFYLKQDFMTAKMSDIIFCLPSKMSLSEKIKEVKFDFHKIKIDCRWDTVIDVCSIGCVRNLNSSNLVQIDPRRFYCVNKDIKNSQDDMKGKDFHIKFRDTMFDNNEVIIQARKFKIL